MIAAALRWIATHPGVLIAPGVLVALSLVNAALPWAALRHGARWRRVLGAVIDALAVLARSDSPQTLTWPVVGRSLAPVVLDALAAPSDPPPRPRRAGDDRTTLPETPPRRP